MCNNLGWWYAVDEALCHDYNRPVVWLAQIDGVVSGNGHAADHGEAPVHASCGEYQSQDVPVLLPMWRV